MIQDSLRPLSCALAIAALGGACSSTDEPIDPEPLAPVEQAATGTYDLAQYMIPSCNTATAYVTNGTGMRRYIPMGIDANGRGRFVYVTSGDGAAFLSFTVDASFIRFWADASWAHNNHPPAPECPGSDFCDEVSGPTGVPTTTCRCLWYHGPGSADYVFNAPRDGANEALGTRFLPRTISLSGESEASYSLGASVTRAQRKSDCSLTSSWHSSPAGTSQTTTIGVTHFASYNGYADVIRVRSLGGPGAGENFFYARNLGWVGYEIPARGYTDWIQSPTGATPSPNLGCLSYSPGEICAVTGGGGGGCTASVPSTSWTGQYWNNTAFSGSPVLTRNDGTGALSFDWGSGSPGAGCGVPVDNFAARWTRTAYFNAGTHRFTVTADDGVRLYVDGVLRIDRWIDQAPTTYTVDLSLAAGNHTVRMDYYERGYGALAALSWAPVGGGGMNEGTPGGANLALSAACSSDTVYGAGWECTRARDGVTDGGSKWTSTGASATHWMSYDLGTTRTVNGYIVRHAGAGGEPAHFNTQQFRIQTATSASGPWTDQAVVDNTAQASVTTRSYNTPTPVRFVRLYITDPGIDNYARIPEFEVRGP